VKSGFGDVIEEGALLCPWLGLFLSLFHGVGVKLFFSDLGIDKYFINHLEMSKS
jgi:hypothetical protein